MNNHKKVEQAVNNSTPASETEYQKSKERSIDRHARLLAADTMHLAEAFCKTEPELLADTGLAVDAALAHAYLAVLEAFKAVAGFETLDRVISAEVVRDEYYKRCEPTKFRQDLELHEMRYDPTIHGEFNEYMAKFIYDYE